MRPKNEELEQRWSDAVGITVRKARTDVGMTQEELAYKSGLSRITLQSVERGRTSPRMATLASICVALEVLPELIVAGANALVLHPAQLRAAVAKREAEAVPGKPSSRGAR